MKNALLIQDNTPEADLTIYPGSILNKGDRVIVVECETVIPPGAVILNGSIVIVRTCSLCLLHHFVFVSDCIMKCGKGVFDFVMGYVIRTQALQKRVVFLEKELKFDKARIQHLMKREKRLTDENKSLVEVIKRKTREEHERIHERRKLNVEILNMFNSLTRENASLIRLLYDYDRMCKDEFERERHRLRKDSQVLIEKLKVIETKLSRPM
jgi:hypothetical protein